MQDNGVKRLDEDGGGGVGPLKGEIDVEFGDIGREKEIGLLKNRLWRAWGGRALGGGETSYEQGQSNCKKYPDGKTYFHISLSIDKRIMINPV